MEEQLIKFRVIRLAIKKGFVMGGFTKINNEGTIKSIGYISTPTQSLLQKWLREVHKISIKVDDFYTDSKLRFDFSVSELGSQDDNPQGAYESYEDALEAGLIEALKFIK